MRRRRTVAMLAAMALGAAGVIGLGPTPSATAQVDAVTASDQVSVTVVADRQPDLTIERNGGPTIGAGLYGLDPSNPLQTAAAARNRNGQVRFFAEIHNDGDTASYFDLRRIGSDSGLTVRYTENRAHPDITPKVVNRTYRTRLLQPGGTATILIDVSVTGTARRNMNHDITLRSRSDADPTQIDTVRARIFVH